ncbi:Rieske (2Fe-2S) protein [Nocardioides sambongensis]|uniref:Rieske (2Fe-2S) protein n=1 Tax=Nocardioides sambongensis TaxID=2589074 RepID=UPI00112ECC34|nr:Rieske (2Fe-2S) protein [Nocardioides sambongensis]
MKDVRASRRIVFQGLGALGVAVALAGCGGGESEAPEVEAGTELATTDEVPVGGGVVLTEEKVVLTQPTDGEFKAFTAVCTHQGLTVTSVDGDTIRCSHHGSAYSATSGEVTGGPATQALAEVAIEVDGDRILSA